MPTDSNGNYTLPPGYEGVSGEPILPSQHNPPLEDLANNMTLRVMRDGRTAMSGNLNLGSNRITNVSNPSSAQDAATKAYVDALPGWSTGDVKLTLKTTADTGWRMFDDGTIGSAASGATYANALAEALFMLLFNAPFNDTVAPIFTSDGTPTTRAAQTNAATAWAANCRMSLLKMLGRALGIAGAGAGLTSRALGETLGAETHVLTEPELPEIDMDDYMTDLGHQHNNAAVSGPSGNVQGGANAGSTAPTASATTGITFAPFGSGAAHNNMQPTTFLNAMVKL